MQRFPVKWWRKLAEPACDVLINLRGVDTKRTVGHLLYDHLTSLRVKPFMGSMNMRAGDKVLEQMEKAVEECKVGVAVFSPRYCESYFCLTELALLVESNKRIVPIFYDVKPSQLQVTSFDASCTTKEIHRFKLALDEAKSTVGLSFDSKTGDWAELLRNASDAIIWNLVKEEEERKRMAQL